MKRLSLAILLFSVVSCLHAQGNTDETGNPLAALNFMIGQWEGEAWTFTQQGKEYSHVLETAEYKLEGSILVVEGLGTKTDTTSGESTVVHHAYGVIFHDNERHGLQMHAYKEGNVTESPIEFVGDRRIRWRMDNPAGGTVRFTVDYSLPNQWIETGEFSRDNENWMQFMGMELTRRQNP